MARYMPMFASLGVQHRFIQADDWWTEIVYQIGAEGISRKKLVLSAADKDGGAHVDKTLNPEYEALTRGVWTVGYTAKEVDVEFPLPNSHLADLREMAYELLNSPALLALAGDD